MGLPGDLTTTTLTGTFLDPAGNPMRGTVTIAPNATLTDATGNVIIPQLQRAYQLFNGSFTSAPLVSTDNTDINPQGFAYVITIALQEVPSYSFTVLLPHSVSPVDLSALSPAVSVPQVASALPVTGGVLTGKLTLDGTIPLQIPAGAAAGDVLTSDASGNASWSSVSADGIATASALAAETSRAETAEALKAPLASPALTGSPTAPTQTPGDSTTKIATDAFATAAANAAQAAAIAASLPTLTANVSVSSSGTLALNTVTEASASGSALTMTLPTSTAGDVIVCEKSDSSTNTVSITGNIRGVSSTTLTLKLQNESTMFLGYAGSWWPVAGHKTLGSLDSRYGEKPATTENVCYVSAAAAASDSNDGLSWGSAKASIAGALTLLGASAGTIMVGPGTFTLSSADGNGNGITLPNQGTVLQGSGQQVTVISVTGTVTWGILCQGQFSAVKDIHLQVASGGSVTYGIGVDTVTSTGTAESCLFESCLSSIASGGTLTNGFAVGPTHTGAAVDIAETMFRRCRSSGAANAGFLVGNGTSGNILNTHMHQCSAVAGVYGVYAQSTGYTWLQGDVGENTTTDFFQNSLSISNPVVIQGLRSENSARLLQSSTQGNSLDIALRDINWEPGTHMSAAGDWISYGMGGTLVLDNVKCTGGSSTPVILLNTTGHLSVTARGLATAAPLGQAFSVSSTQTIGITVNGYIQLSSSGGDPPVLVTSAAVRLGWTSPTVSINGTSRNVAAPVEVQTLNSNGAVTINGSAEFAEINLKANATSSSITNMMPGQRYTISWIQDSTGGRTYAWPSACVFPGGVTPPASTGAGLADTCTFAYDGTSLVALSGWDVSAISGTAVSGAPTVSGQSLVATGAGAAGWTTLAAGVVLDTTTADIQPAGTPAAGSVGMAADSGHVHPVTFPFCSDTGYLAWTGDPVTGSMTKTSANLGIYQTSGAICLTRLNIPRALTANGFLSFYWVQPTTGSPANSFVGLYNASGTRLWTSSDLTSTATGPQRLNTSVTSYTAGPLYVASLIGTQGSSNGGLGFFSGALTLGSAALQTGSAPWRSSVLTGSATSLPSSLTYSGFSKTYYYAWSALD